MRVWAITGGRRGNDVLVLGVAKALGVEPQLIHTHLKPPWRWLAPIGRRFPACDATLPSRHLSRPCAGKRAAGRGARAI